MRHCPGPAVDPKSWGTMLELPCERRCAQQQDGQYLHAVYVIRHHSPHAQQQYDQCMQAAWCVCFLPPRLTTYLAPAFALSHPCLCTSPLPSFMWPSTLQPCSSHAHHVFYWPAAHPPLLAPTPRLPPPPPTHPPAPPTTSRSLPLVDQARSAQPTWLFPHRPAGLFTRSHPLSSATHPLTHSPTCCHPGPCPLVDQDPLLGPVCRS